MRIKGGDTGKALIPDLCLTKVNFLPLQGNSKTM